MRSCEPSRIFLMTPPNVKRGIGSSNSNSISSVHGVSCMFSSPAESEACHDLPNWCCRVKEWGHTHKVLNIRVPTLRPISRTPPRMNRAIQPDKKIWPGFPFRMKNKEPMSCSGLLESLDRDNPYACTLGAAVKACAKRVKIIYFFGCPGNLSINRDT